jgi:hypothetical protein
MTHFPPPVVHEQRKRILKYIGMALSALMVLTVLTVFALILRNESAHDEQACPFQPAGERPFEGGRVVEQQRTCVSGISEHRYLIERPGQKPFELARKRLASDRFEANRFRWDVAVDDKRRVVLNMNVDGKPSSEFREEDAVPH